MEHKIIVLEDAAKIADCHLQRSTKDSIRWVNPTNQAYYVDFHNESPFEDAHFTIDPNNGEATSGPVKNGAQAKHYHYDLAPARVGVVAADPTVIVH